MSKHCYEKSKEEKQICRRIFDNDGRSVFDYFSFKLSLPFVLPIILIVLVELVVTTAVVSYLVLDFTSENKIHPERNNLLGDLISSSMFLMIICLLNIHDFDPKSFCVMNPREKLCDPHRESLFCANTQNLNTETGMGNYLAQTQLPDNTLYDGHIGRPNGRSM